VQTDLIDDTPTRDRLGRLSSKQRVNVDILRALLSGFTVKPLVLVCHQTDARLLSS
jgi:hypothetical protein